jgi:ubiquinol-cytochrome c reductase cytochrome c subunit
MRRLRLLAMVLLGSAAALALVPGASAAPANRQPVAAPPAADSAAEVATGRALYLASCQTCHGSDGQGTTLGQSLVGVGAAAADFELRTGRMPYAGPTGSQAVRKPPAFDDASIRALVAYVASLGPGPAIPSPVVDAAQISNGQRLFVQNCAPCHGVTANGGAVGGGALAPPLDKATAVEVAEAMLIGPGQMPVFSGIAETDRNAIVSYVEYLRSAPNPGGFSIGGIGPVPEGYAAWLLGMALLVIIIVLIGRDWKGGTQ